ncbi:unnamed protein product [Leptidea sinapis]|uniref:Uncharacterized protein n=1 Tax=Leptidea sinapis TaxID=189913 RepID=A0A5E4PSD1_9NEOP|nr:unnamed protein product [Leptidea sinapis]
MNYLCSLILIVLFLNYYEIIHCNSDIESGVEGTISFLINYCC